MPHHKENARGRQRIVRRVTTSRGVGETETRLFLFVRLERIEISNLTRKVCLFKYVFVYLSY